MLFQNVFFKTLHLNKKLFEDWIFWGKKIDHRQIMKSNMF